MSQRMFTQGNLSVFAGWDRPLKYFFVVVERVDAKDEDEDEGYVFSNLRDRPPGKAGMTLDEIRDVLKANNLTAPPTFFDDLMGDKVENRDIQHVYKGGES